MSRRIVTLAVLVAAGLALVPRAADAEKVTVVLAQNTIGPNEAVNAFIPSTSATSRKKDWRSTSRPRGAGRR